ncbi:hypothetical protein M0R45_026327 [Rubus argutus]|uniref:Secreted protein n=1 Tax=Rubus argutus TaxID=59490 RepID=A0AAW1WX78_RUBAR
MGTRVGLMRPWLLVKVIVWILVWVDGEGEAEVRWPDLVLNGGGRGKGTTSIDEWVRAGLLRLQVWL